MSSHFTIGRVQFAEAQYDLLIGYFLVILASFTIAYFALFVDNKHEVQDEDDSDSLKPEPVVESNSVDVLPPEPVAIEDAPAKAATPKKTPSKTPSKTPKKTPKSEKKEEVVAPLPEPAPETHHEENLEEDHEDKRDEPVTPKRTRGRKSGEAPKDFGQVLSPEGRRTSLRLRKKREDY